MTPVNQCPNCKSRMVEPTRPQWGHYGDYREVEAEWECKDCDCMWLTTYKYHGTDEHPDWGEDNG